MPLKERSGKLLREFININCKVINSQNRNENRKQAPEWRRRIPEPIQFFFSYFFSYSASTLQRMIRSLPLGSAGISSTHSKW